MTDEELKLFEKWLPFFHSLSKRVVAYNHMDGKMRYMHFQFITTKDDVPELANITVEQLRNGLIGDGIVKMITIQDGDLGDMIRYDLSDLGQKLFGTLLKL